MAWVYMLANRKRGTIYTGATEDIDGRIWEHKVKFYKGFTAKYDVQMLVWLSDFPSMTEAIRFESSLKRWRRDWKIKLIEEANPEWRDLSSDLL